MSDLFQSKSTLARLLAQENINVEHRKVHTAMFDLKSRTLILPMLKDMDSDLYDGLTGHEVGHALFTPEEGWHTAIKQDRSLKGYLNIIEDARIERKMKERFPGLRRSFNLAYKHLNELDFFGLKGIDVNRMMLIDRINIFYKIGSFVRVGFSTDELTYLDRISAAQTWEEVEVIARELHAKAKEDKRNNPEPQTDTHEDSDDSDDSDDSEDGEYGESEYSDSEEGSDSNEDWDDLDDMSYEDDSDDSEEGKDSDKKKKPTNSDDESDEKSDESDEDGNSGASKDDKSDEGAECAESDDKNADGSKSSNDENGEDKNEKTSNGGDSKDGKDSDNKDKTDKSSPNKNREGGNESEIDPDVSSHTDRAFRDNEKSLVDTSTGNTYVVNVPQFNKNYLVSHQKIHSAIRAHINYLAGETRWTDHNPMIKEFSIDNVQDFIKRSAPVINYMIKEFEMRKNATQLARAKQHKSGKINPKRLSRYTMENDIFQRITSVPQGKNHGLVMVIDLSGSMTEILKDTFEQAMMLSMFCRKVNIPFDVYGFCDHHGSVNLLDSKRGTYFTENVNDLSGMSTAFTMKQYLSSTMTSSQYRQALSNMMFVSSVYSAYRVGKYRHLSDAIPPSEHLGGTPLDEAIIASIDLVGEFKMHNRLDIVNCIFLTDGCGGVSNAFYTSKVNKMSYHGNQEFMCIGRDTIYLQHKGTKYRARYQNYSKGGGHDNFTSARALIEIAKRVTGAKYTGYLVDRKRNIANFVFNYEYTYVDYNTQKIQRKSMTSKLDSEGYLSSHKFGFDEYFFVPNDNLRIEEHGIDVESEASKNKIAKAFMKSLDKRGLQRMFLNKFVQNLAA